MPRHDKRPPKPGRITLPHLTDQAGNPLVYCPTPDGIWVWYRGRHHKTFWPWPKLIRAARRKDWRQSQAQADDVRWGEYFLTQRGQGWSAHALALHMLEHRVEPEKRWSQPWSARLVDRLCEKARRARKARQGAGKDGG